MQLQKNSSVATAGFAAGKTDRRKEENGRVCMSTYRTTLKRPSKTVSPGQHGLFHATKYLSCNRGAGLEASRLAPGRNKEYEAEFCNRVGEVRLERLTALLIQLYPKFHKVIRAIAHIDFILIRPMVQLDRPNSNIQTFARNSFLANFRSQESIRFKQS